MEDGPDPKATGSSEDVVLLHGRTEDGDGYQALRAHEGRVELAEIRPVKEGHPLTGSELVSLHPREHFPLLCDVKVLYRRGESDEPVATTGHEGPARVSSRAFRKNWDEVFGRPHGRGKKDEPAN